MSMTHVHLQLPPATMERLRWLKKKTEASSYSEVIRRALEVYEAQMIAQAAPKEDEAIRVY